MPARRSGTRRPVDEVRYDPRVPRGFLKLLPAGPTFELTHGLSRIGRGKSCEVSVQSPALGRVHSQVARRGDGFWLTDLGSTYGTWVASRGARPARIHQAHRLSEGDVVGLHVPLRFTGGEPAPWESALRDQVIAEPEDGQRWLRWADALGAISDPRALRIASASTQAEWQAPQQLTIDLDWAYGHVRGAVIRELRHPGFELPALLGRFLWAPSVELIVDLAVELLPGAARGTAGTAASAIFHSASQQLEASELPALRRLTVRGLEVGAMPGSPRVERR